MNKILFIDTLTTGLNSDRCAIYRLGGIICEENVKSLKEIKAFDLLMRPFHGARIIDESLAVGGMTRSRMIYFPDEKKVFEEFMSIISSVIDIRNPKDKLYIVGLHASSFDVPFLKAWFNRNGNTHFRDCFYVQTLDLMSLAAFYLMGQRTAMANFYMDNMAKALNVEVFKDEEHSNISTVRTGIQVYRELKKRMVGMPLEMEEETELYCNLPE